MSSMKYLLTGAPRSGKTTLCKRLAEGLAQGGHTVGGMLSGELREKGERVGFEILDILTGEKGTLAHVDQRSGPRVGKYKVALENLEGVGVGSILGALDECDIVIIDEIGPMELKSRAFIDAVKETFASHKDVVATIHLKTRERLVRELDLEDVPVITIDETTRDGALLDLMEVLDVEASTK